MADEGDAAKSDTRAQGDLMRLARMFVAYRDDPVMRELCRLAVKCAQEQWIKAEVSYSDR